MPAGICPVCQARMADFMCPYCGFDESLCYERYASLTLIAGERSEVISELRMRHLSSFGKQKDDMSPEKLYHRALAVKNDAERIELLSKAAFLGCVPAQKLLGDTYLETGNSKLAAELYRQAALSGDADACYQLSHCYRDGIGSEPSGTIALSWLRKAVGLGNMYAKQELGDHYLFGKGVEKNVELAQHYYEEAAAHGLPSGLYYLAVCYLKGNQVPASKPKAIELLKRAANYGDMNAEFLLSQLQQK